MSLVKRRAFLYERKVQQHGKREYEKSLSDDRLFS